MYTHPFSFFSPLLFLKSNSYNNWTPRNCLGIPTTNWRMKAALMTVGLSWWTEERAEYNIRWTFFSGGRGGGERGVRSWTSSLSTEVHVHFAQSDTPSSGGGLWLEHEHGSFEPQTGLVTEKSWVDNFVSRRRSRVCLHATLHTATIAPSSATSSSFALAEHATGHPSLNTISTE